MVRFGGRDSWDGSGGFRDALSRIFSENPLDWALPLYRAWGVRVRVHLLFIVFAAAQLIYAAFRTGGHLGPAYMAIGIASLFLLVLLHEYGHVVACRKVGGEADDILMWPLGGLASAMPPDTWQANLITTVGGPLVNLILLPVFAAGLLLAGGGWDSVIFNPFSPTIPLSALGSWWLVALWWLHYANLILLAFNVLVPMFPMDGGRIVQALVWSRKGYESSMRVAVVLGMVIAATLIIFGMVAAQPFLMGIGLFGGIVCWWERHKLAAAAELGGGIDLSAAYERPDPVPPPPLEEPSRRELRRRQREAETQDELDRILAKIAEQGLQSLTRQEQRILERETERRRRGSTVEAD